MDCPICGCLGFSSPSYWQKERESKFCSFDLQASSLLPSAASDSDLRIYIHRNFPARIYPTFGGEFYDGVEVYALLDEPNESFPRLGKYVPIRADSEESLRFLETSYETCMKEHAECHQEDTQLPKRLVDISGPIYRLVESQEPPIGVYAALSYCWGSRSSKMLTSQNITNLKKGTDWESMPICFKYTAAIARRLGIYFLWIDTLCIIQDDEQDWEAESGKMAEVYQNAALVIAASSSSNPHDSFLMERDPEFREISLNAVLQNQEIPMTFKARRTVTLGFHTTYPDYYPRSPLDSRAWALQERVLATRYLSFTQAELQWQCKRHNLCECQESMGPAPPGLKSYGDANTDSKSTNIFRYWEGLVENYTSRTLSFPEDVLPALGGVAKNFSHNTGATYIAGLWKEYLIGEISWRRRSTLLRPVTQYLAPSFSWASVSGAVFYAGLHIPDACRIYHSEVIQAQCSTTTRGGLFGRVTGGEVTIRGPTMVAELHSTDAVNEDSYHLRVAGRTFQPNPAARVNCRLWIDTFLTSFETPCSKVQTKVPTLGRSTREVTGPISGTVLLLSLQSLVYETQKDCYEIFLLLGKSSTTPGAYERLGMGMGPISRPPSTKQVLPADIEPPFYWTKLYDDNESEDLYIPEMMQIRIV